MQVTENTLFTKSCSHVSHMSPTVFQFVHQVWETRWWPTCHCRLGTDCWIDVVRGDRPWPRAHRCLFAVPRLDAKAVQHVWCCCQITVVCCCSYVFWVLLLRFLQKLPLSRSQLVSRRTGIGYCEGLDTGERCDDLLACGERAGFARGCHSWEVKTPPQGSGQMLDDSLPCRLVCLSQLLIWFAFQCVCFSCLLGPVFHHWKKFRLWCSNKLRWASIWIWPIDHIGTWHCPTVVQSDRVQIACNWHWDSQELWSSVLMRVSTCHQPAQKNVFALWCQNSTVHLAWAPSTAWMRRSSAVSTTWLQEPALYLATKSTKSTVYNFSNFI